MNDLLVIFATLAGFGALVSLLVNVGKYFGIVKDGTADKWVAGLNLVGLVALFVIKTWFPQIDIMQLDANLGAFVIVLTVVFDYIITILGSKLTYLAVKNLPIIGKSYSG